MIISVTQEDIDKGQRHNGHLCPVALAIRRTAPDCYGVLATIKYIEYIYNGGRVLYLVTPASVRQFIRDFDYNEPVTQFSFELNV